MVADHQVKHMLKAANLRKATGPDGVPGLVLKDCMDQLAEVFTRIFNQSLPQAAVPLLEALYNCSSPREQYQ